MMKQMPSSQRIDGEDANICRGDDERELVMRNFSVTMLAAGILAVSSPLRAQTYSPDYPVCLHVYGIVTYWECLYSTMEQCNATASGRAAQCAPNPYLAYASAPPARSSKRVRPVY